MEKVKKILVVAAMATTLVGIFLAHVILPDGQLSAAERRKLAQLPELTWDEVFSGDYFSDLEEYLLDQFPLRQTFRTLKARFQYNVLGMRDNNDLYYVDGHLMKLDYPLKESQAKLAIDKFNAVLDAHPQIGAAYYSLIPDKNYFLAEANGYPAMDYAALLEQARGINAEYIDIFPLLSIDDYYRTDSHWRQECSVDVAQHLCSAMGTAADGAEAYEQVGREGFRGVYYGQSALNVDSETLTTMISDVTESAAVKSLEHEEPLPVYNWDDFAGLDPYDVYLSGAEALITMDNPLQDNGSHLIVFRDSFGSSISPLLLSGYSRVTLVDLRYIASGLLDEYVDFTDADVLILYSTAMFNAGATLK